MGKKDLKHRTQFTSTLKIQLYEDIQKLSNETQIPISRLLDMAVTDFLQDHYGQVNKAKNIWLD
jgi:hypothetical protein